jgi:hypothetical protein
MFIDHCNNFLMSIKIYVNAEKFVPSSIYFKNDQTPLH